MFDWLIGMFDEQIIGYIVAAIIAFLGWRWVILKNLMKELKLLFSIITDALEDDELTEEERKAVMAKLQDVAKLIKQLLDKEKPVVKRIKAFLA